MQTDIKVTQAFGMVGEMYDLTPRRVDAFETETDINIGDVVGYNASGKLGKADATTFTKYAGICVRAKEQIMYGGTNPLDPSLRVPAGCTTQVASMGRIVVGINLTATADNEDTDEAAKEAAKTAIKALTDIKEGDTLYYKDGALTAVSTGATAIGKFVRGSVIADDIAIVSNVAEADATHSGKRKATATGYVLVVIEIG